MDFFFFSECGKDLLTDWAFFMLLHMVLGFGFGFGFVFGLVYCCSVMSSCNIAKHNMAWQWTMELTHPPTHENVLFFPV